MRRMSIAKHQVQRIVTCNLIDPNPMLEYYTDFGRGTDTSFDIVVENAITTEV